MIASWIALAAGVGSAVGIVQLYRELRRAWRRGDRAHARAEAASLRADREQRKAIAFSRAWQTALAAGNEAAARAINAETAAALWQHLADQRDPLSVIARAKPERLN